MNGHQTCEFSGTRELKLKQSDRNYNVLYGKTQDLCEGYQRINIAHCTATRRQTFKQDNLGLGLGTKALGKNLDW